MHQLCPGVHVVMLAGRDGVVSLLSVTVMCHVMERQPVSGKRHVAKFEGKKGLSNIEGQKEFHQTDEWRLVRKKNISCQYLNTSLTSGTDAFFLALCTEEAELKWYRVEILKQNRLQNVFKQQYSFSSLSLLHYSVSSSFSAFLGHLLSCS